MLYGMSVHALCASSSTTILPRLFIIALITATAGGVSNIMYGMSASELSAKLRKLSFRAIMWQDSELFLIVNRDLGYNN